MQDKTVSVFETTIRILGGLLSAHLIASDYATVYYPFQLQYYACYLNFFFCHDYLFKLQWMTMLKLIVSWSIFIGD